MKRLTLPLLITLCCSLPARADDAATRADIEKLNARLEALKAELQAVESRNSAGADSQQPAIDAAGTTASRAPAPSPLTVWGYGEINYNRPTNDSAQTRMDLRRAVVGLGYRFDDDTRFNSEFEIEHAVASASDTGEVEVEQFYVDHTLTVSTNLKAGLFLIPMGLLNETHEPNRYYSVERNFVETAIIPTTWREGGVGVYGSTELGLSWDAGVTTGFDLGKWDPTSTEGIESPLGSIHQELQNAKARDLSTYLALNYRGLPGWVAGASVFTGRVAQGNPDIRLAADARVTLWETHTRWTPGNFDLSALYARGTISDTAALNATFVGNPTLIPEAFWGWYAQAAYKIRLQGTSDLSPFVRYERFNTSADYAPLPAGLGVSPLPTETVWTWGANFNLNSNVVFKVDYQRFAEASDRDRFDVGLGVAF